MRAGLERKPLRPEGLVQLFTGSKSAKNNPYSERVGSQVIAEREKAKQED